MIIKTIKLNNYRNYDYLDINLDKNLNIFIGDNGQGKSNILESIYVLAVTKSYSSVKDRELIMDGRDYSFIESSICNDIYNHKISIYFDTNKKIIKYDNKEVKKFVDYISKLKVILFNPDNIRMIKDSPNIRRKYLNIEISQMSNNYIINLQNYNLLLRQRNEFLKSIKNINSINYNYLSVLNYKFSDLAVKIIKERYKFLCSINENINNIYNEIMDISGLNVKYISCISNVDNLEEMKNDFLIKLEKNFDKEKLYGMTLIGPHRDDFKFFIDNRDMLGYASQGQLRSAVLSLKLAEINIFKLNTGDYPILLLDDIFSELDIKKKNRLIKYMIDDVQTIITTTDLNMIDNSLIEKAKIFEIVGGKVVNEVERKVVQNGE